MINFTHEIEPHRAAFFELEYSASSAYNEFVYRSRSQADAVRTLLVDNRVGEFSWPYCRAIVEDDELVGFITCLSAEQLKKCRMKSAFAIGKSGFFDEDPELSKRMQVAAGTLALVVEGDFYISRIAVGEKFWGRGYAGLLMRRAQEEAARSGARRLTLEVASQNLQAYSMYRRLGFEEIERRHAKDPATRRSLTYIHMARLL